MKRAAGVGGRPSSSLPTASASSNNHHLPADQLQLLSRLLRPKIRRPSISFLLPPSCAFYHLLPTPPHPQCLAATQPQSCMRSESAIYTLAAHADRYASTRISTLS